MGKDRAVLAGAAAAASHKRETQAKPVDQSTPVSSATPRRAIFGDPDAATEDSLSPVSLTKEIHGINAKKSLVDVEGANDVVNDCDQLEEVFDVVKAELAAGRGGATQRPDQTASSPIPREKNLKAPHGSRADHIQVSCKPTCSHMSMLIV